MGGVDLTSTLTPSLIGVSFAGVPSSAVATFEASLFLGGMVNCGVRIGNWGSENW